MKSSYRIIFAGTPPFAASILDALLHVRRHQIIAIYTQPDRPQGRGQKLLGSAVKQLALQHHLPIYQPATLRDSAAQHVLADLSADIMIVVAFGLILPSPILQAPRLGCINVHASLLPRWRGAAPIQRAILAGDPVTGITIMQMDEGLDTGPMLYRVECPISVTDTSETLHSRLALLGTEGLLHTLDQLAENAAVSMEPQQQADATYANKILKSEAALDWHFSAEALNRKIRAFIPWPVAQTMWGSRVLRIWEAEVLDTRLSSSVCPGSIVRSAAEGIDVATGEGVLRLKKIQWPGGRVLMAADMAHSSIFTVSSGIPSVFR